MIVSMPPQPWANNYQRQADDAFNRATSMSDDELRQLRPPLPQIPYLPPRFGYPTYEERQWNIMQVFGIDRLPSGGLPPRPSIRPQDRVDYSGSQAAMAGSDRNTNYSPLGLGAGGN